MSDSDVPVGGAGGLSDISEAPTAPFAKAAVLPSRLRVHALAKLIAATSRQVLDVLTDLGEPAKGVQSSISRDTAIRVARSLGREQVLGVASDALGSGEISPPAEPAEIDRAALGPSFAPAHNADVDVSAEPELEPESPSGALPLFAVPRPMFLPPEPVARPAKAKEAPKPKTSTPAKVEEPVTTSDKNDDAEDANDDGADEVEDSAETKRRRRRGRRGRGRGRGGDDEAGEGTDSESDSESDESADPRTDDTEATEDESGERDDGSSSEEGNGSSRRRRRRRRRKDTGDASDSEGGDQAASVEDPPNTITKIRESRAAKVDEDVNHGIQGVRGSTRLEAKRQRRREGRDAGRRRAPVLSEAEFLARRESVERTMVVRQHGARSEIGVLEDGVLVEHFVTSSGGSSLVGNVYLGRVQNVLPSMEAAFVDIGRGRNAVLYAGEVDWDAAGLAGKARRIEQALSSGDIILVQVTKDPIGHKGARLTTQISLPGRFLVYVPSGGTHGISRKLADTERRRLKDLLREIVPDDAGVIIRTASEGVSQEALERDVRRLQAQWDVVKERADAAAKSSGKSKNPELLYEEPDLMIKVVRDQFNEDFAKLVVQGDEAWDTLHAYVGHVAPELTERLNRHVGLADVFSEHRIDEQLMKALDRKVWLPSGGTLVIDRTEAMTVIDVNTGKFTGSGGNLEETVTRNNLEAAEEIVRQLRLRDIGGIIVIDFIDMVLESNRDLVLRRLTECLGRDRTRHQVAEVTSLGLVQMTRKRVGVGLLEAFSTPCEHCRGRGVVVSADPVEPHTDNGQQGGAGRRRGRSGAEQAEIGNQRGGAHNHNSGGNNGNGQAGEAKRVDAVAQDVSRRLADVHAASNGRSIQAESSQGARSESSTSGPTDPGSRPADGPLSTAPPESVNPQISAPAPTELVSDDSAELTLGQPEQVRSGPSEPGQATEPTEPANWSGDEQPDWVAVGAPPPAEAARPGRRRRRSASRPAGPPGATESNGDPV